MVWSVPLALQIARPGAHTDTHHKCTRSPRTLAGRAAPRWVWVRSGAVRWRVALGGRRAGGSGRGMSRGPWNETAPVHLWGASWAARHRQCHPKLQRLRLPLQAARLLLPRGQGLPEQHQMGQRQMGQGQGLAVRRPVRPQAAGCGASGAAAAAARSGGAAAAR